jgi:hypothetical protein
LLRERRRTRSGTGSLDRFCFRRQRATPQHATYGRPEPATEAIVGAPAIKSATLTVTVDYETDAPLS